jgi:hypothetical protein
MYTGSGAGGIGNDHPSMTDEDAARVAHVIKLEWNG